MYLPSFPKGMAPFHSTGRTVVGQCRPFKHCPTLKIISNLHQIVKWTIWTWSSALNLPNSDLWVWPFSFLSNHLMASNCVMRIVSCNIWVLNGNMTQNENWHSCYSEHLPTVPLVLAEVLHCLLSSPWAKPHPQCNSFLDTLDWSTSMTCIKRTTSHCLNSVDLLLCCQQSSPIVL